MTKRDEIIEAMHAAMVRTALGSVPACGTRDDLTPSPLELAVAASSLDAALMAMMEPDGPMIDAGDDEVATADPKRPRCQPVWTTMLTTLQAKT